MTSRLLLSLTNTEFTRLLKRRACSIPSASTLSDYLVSATIPWVLFVFLLVSHHFASIPLLIQTPTLPIAVADSTILIVLWPNHNIIFDPSLYWNFFLSCSCSHIQDLSPRPGQWPQMVLSIPRKKKKADCACPFPTYSCHLP